MPFVTHPYTIYHLRKKQVSPNCSATKSRYEWERCTDKKERKIVLRETFQIAKEKATEENVYDNLKCYRIRDVRDYLGIMLGIEYPPNRPYYYYQRWCKQIKNVKQLTKDQKYYIKLRFNRITFRKQLLYLKRFLDHWLGFFYKLKKWKIKNNDFFNEALTKIAVTFPKERTKRLLKEKLRRKKFFELCMPHTRSDFADAPEPPPALTSIQLFQLMLADEGGPKDENVIRNAFEKLPLIIQNSIEDKVIDIREEFTTKLFNYVCSMTETRRKLFLGLKREYYFKLFFVDIFKRKYPNEKYPVYKRNSDDFVKKTIIKKMESSKETLPSKDHSFNSDDFDAFKLIDDSLLRLKNYGFQIDSSDSET